MKIKKPTKKTIIFFLLSVTFFTYLTSGLLIFFLNGLFNLNLFNQIAEHYNLLFTYKAVIRSYPKVWESIFYCWSFWSVIIGFFMYFDGGKKSLHGEARFANKKEIEKMGLLQDKGLVVGKLESGELLKWDSSEFLALGAPTRSGKGVGIVIPNLMEWEESCVVLDIKQECFDFSSKYRRDILGQEVYLFNPFDFRTHRYNPFTYIDLQNDRTRDKSLLNFANILYPTDGKKEAFFDQQAQNLFIGLAYIMKDLMYSDKGQEFLKENDFSVEWSLDGILTLSTGFKIPYIDEDEEKFTNGFDETFEYLETMEIVSPSTIQKMSLYFNITSENTKSSVMSSFNSPLLIYSNEPFKTAMSESDFDLRDLRKKKMTIYIGITPDDLPLASPILNMFFNQLLALNTATLPEKDSSIKYTCLLLMDEFTSIGYIPILKKGVSFIAGFWLRLMMVFQAPSQLEDAPPNGYGKEGATTLQDNMGMAIFYAPRSVKAAKEISEMLGDMTFKAVSKSYNHGKLLEAGSSSHSVSEQRRALMLPQELREMVFEKEIITMPGYRPIQCTKAFYYNDEYFISKFKKISPYMRSIKNPTSKDWKIMLQKNETAIDVPVHNPKSA
ncbi:type IV secretory system conjugative DNA transfer family protein [Aliarcobacter butzleri]|uniref:type IV secretory system conjugative DNA transfer family protein n=1 Tax=Aliarcobacter butzleri TaxID=28197 RepID=UPI001EDA3539|nr:type IV secretory system conjugative DNA transfer family protein [Aliarcobacter butzleri]MCG3667493.1 type IV secretory system conjugative DNA transfer family protein [Aliarcobacter butzleri]MDN5112943.1 type IV secretory system conjugative DNA transfer family protein [Aliarcobacter butzleri]